MGVRVDVRAALSETKPPSWWKYGGSRGSLLHTDAEHLSSHSDDCLTIVFQTQMTKPAKDRRRKNRLNHPHQCDVHMITSLKKTTSGRSLTVIWRRQFRKLCWAFSKTSDIFDAKRWKWSLIVSLHDINIPVVGVVWAGFQLDFNKKQKKQIRRTQIQEDVLDTEGHECKVWRFHRSGDQKLPFV